MKKMKGKGGMLVVGCEAFGFLMCYFCFRAGSEEKKKVKREVEGDEGRQETIDFLFLTRLPFLYFLLSWSKASLRR